MSAEPQTRSGSPQFLWLFIFFLVAVGTFLATDLLARNRDFERWEMAESSELSARNGKLFSNTGNFTDYEERVFLDEIPNASSGDRGVYFFGTSNMKWAFTTWDLPEPLRDRLHNYGVGASTHQTTLRLVRYLIDRGQLRGDRKSEVILGTSFHLGAKEGPSSYFPALLKRQAIYAIGANDRLIETGVNPAERWWRVEKARSSGLISNLLRLLNNAVLAQLGRSHQPPHDPEAYRAGWRSYMGENWPGSIDREVGYLAETIELLRSHNIPVKIVFLPQGTWMNGLPFGPYYDAKVRTLAARTGTPIVDWSHSLPDTEFIDSNHLTLSGQTKFRKMMLSEEAGYLRN